MRNISQSTTTSQKALLRDATRSRSRSTCCRPANKSSKHPSAGMKQTSRHSGKPPIRISKSLKPSFLTSIIGWQPERATWQFQLVFKDHEQTAMRRELPILPTRRLKTPSQLSTLSHVRAARVPKHRE